MSSKPSQQDILEARRAAIAAAGTAKSERRQSVVVALCGVAGAALALTLTIVFIFANASGRDLGEVDQPDTANTAGAIVLGSGDLGQGNDGAPVVEVYSDYMCSFCSAFEQTNGATLASLAADGDITLNYHLISILDSHTTTQYSTRAASAAAVVAQDAPEAFSAFHHALFAAQPVDNPAGLSDEQIGSVAVNVGVPQDVAATFKDHAFTPFAKATTSAAAAAGITSTPTIIIDGTVLDTGTYDWSQAGQLEKAIADLSN